MYKNILSIVVDYPIGVLNNQTVSQISQSIVDCVASLFDLISLYFVLTLINQVQSVRQSI